MKFIKIIALISILISCSTENETQNNKFYKSVSENNIYSNSALQFEFGAALVTRVEDVGAPIKDYEKDTGGRGADAIPLKVSVKGNYSFVKDDDLQVIVKIFNKANNSFINILNSGQKNNTVMLETGDYILQFISEKTFTDSLVGFQNIFMYPLEGSNNIFNYRLSKWDCQNVNLSGIDLSNYDLQKVNLSGSDISNATLKNIDLKESICIGTSFHSSTLFAGRLTYANFQKADFSKSDLQYVYLSYSDCTGAAFCNANHYGWIITGVKRDNTTKCWNE